MEITTDGTAVRVGNGKPVPCGDLAGVNKFLQGLHLAKPPELSGAPACKGCFAESVMRLYAVNAVAYRRTGTSSVVLVDLCGEHTRLERTWAAFFGWPLHVIPEPLSLGAQYRFELVSDDDGRALKRHLADHADVLDALCDHAHDLPAPAAAGGNTEDAGMTDDSVLSSVPEVPQAVGNETVTPDGVPVPVSAQEGGVSGNRPRSTRRDG